MSDINEISKLNVIKRIKNYCKVEDTLRIIYIIIYSFKYHY